MPSVTKQGILPRATKDPLWAPERISKWIVRLIVDGLIFFCIMASTFEYIDTSNWFSYFLFLFGILIVSDIFAFILSYAIIKFLYAWLFKRRVKTFMSTIQYRRRLKKMWIYIFTISWEVIFFLIAFSTIAANKIPLPDVMAYMMAWAIIWFSARVLGRLVYFIFYTF